MSHFLKQLRLFFDFKITNFQDVISILLGIGVFGLILFRAYFTDITYDEAYTYLNTGRIQDVWKIYLFRIANTHVLNSLLMTITTLFFPYNDFFIRLPSVLISVFYISTAISISKKYKNRLIAIGLLLLFHYIIEYMALARGYGMSATFILAALFVYKEKDKFPSYYIWISYFFLLAVYANYVALIPFGVAMMYIYFVDFKGKLPEISTKNKRWIIGLTVLAVHGFYSVTKAGKPLPGTNKHTFMEAIPHDILSRFFASNTIPVQYATIGVITLIVLVISIYIIDKRKNAISAICILTFSTIFIVAWVGSKQLPSGRVLVPYWPLIALLIIETLDFVTNKLRINNGFRVVLNTMILGLLIFNFQSQLQVEKFIVSKSNQWKKPIAILSRYGEEIFPHNTYYLEKDVKHNILQKHLQDITPEEVINKSSVEFKLYDSLRLITVSFKEPNDDTKLFREVIGHSERLYSDTISLYSAHNYYANDQLMLFPFPRVSGDLLVIGNLNGQWKQQFKIPKGMEHFFPIEMHLGTN